MKRKINGIHIIAMALLMTLIMASSAFATSSWTYQERISVQTGEPLYIDWSSSTSTTGTLTAVNSSYYPADFVLWVGDGSAPTVSNGTATYQYETQTTLEDDDATVVTNKAYQIHLNGAGTIKVTLDGTEYTVTNSAPSGTAPSATKPTGFNGYLPIGQFARGTGWGAINTDGSNTASGTKKFINGYASTGISLGVPGGFTDYTFYADNSSSHPYGIDFIVYGNAFTGNPEAGAVKVYGFTKSSGGTGKWYDLAGSLYYSDALEPDNTQNPSLVQRPVKQNNQDVYWKLVVSTDANAKGIFYQVVDAGSSPASDGWTRFTTNYTWWPFVNSTDGTISDAKGYAAINGMTSGAYATDDVEVSADRKQIVYKNINLIKDTDATDDYQFGYFDVHANGSNYGTAANPYSATASTQGGDGYDLSWAVDSNGKPVVLDHITKVRVYTAAALEVGVDAHSNTNLFTKPTIFGETSAEVCGIYGVNGTSGSAASVVPTVKVNNVGVSAPNMGYKSYNGSAFTVTCSSSNMYINGSKISGGSYSDTISAGSTKTYQIITQNGTEAAYITVVRVTNTTSN
jgi:hypothetical protein